MGLMKIHEAQLGLQRLMTLLLEVVETNAEKADRWFGHAQMKDRVYIGRKVLIGNSQTGPKKHFTK